MGESSWRRTCTGAATVLLLVSGPTLAEDLQQRIDACAGISANTDRLACFDALVSASKSDDVTAKPAAEPTAASPPAEVAKSEAEDRSPPIISEDNEVFNVRLTRCAETSASGRQVYYFDNGEVWRQSNSGRNTVRNCDAAVTIRKDGFGYKMFVPDENRSIRIRPVR